jgi:hypothetical protein
VSQTSARAVIVPRTTIVGGMTMGDKKVQGDDYDAAEDPGQDKRDQERQKRLITNPNNRIETIDL